MDTLDLYSARQRAAFFKQAAAELGVEPRVVEARRRAGAAEARSAPGRADQAALAPAEPAEVELTRRSGRRRWSCCATRGCWIDAGRLRTLRGGRRGGGQADGYLAAVSRRLRRPLAVLVQSSSAAGKSALMECGAGLRLRREPDQLLGDDRAEPLLHGRADLKHKVLAGGRGGGRRAGELCLEAPAVGRRADDRLDRQGPLVGQARDPRVPGRGAGGDAF